MRRATAGPRFSDGKHALFTVHPTALVEDDGKLAILSLATRQWKVVVEGSPFGRYLPSGHLLYGRRGSLFAAPFDLGRLALTGSAVEVVSDVNMRSESTGQTLVATSSDGALAYVPGYPRPEPRVALLGGPHRPGDPSELTAPSLPPATRHLSP